MAFNTGSEKALSISINLGNVVARQVEAMVAVRKQEQARSEAAFQQIVIDEGLSYEAQLEYRKQQLEKENAKSSPDPDYIKDLKASITELRKLLRFKKIRDNYTKVYDAYVSGRGNLQQVEKFLLEELAKNPTEDERSELQKELTNIRQEIRSSEINALKNRVTVAEKDGTVALLQTTADEVAKKKAFAILNGNDEEASMWDVYLTSLRKQMNEAIIENSIQDIGFKITRSGMSPLQKLDELNKQLANSDPSTPVTVNGVRFNSAKDYWTTVRDNYISGVGTLPNFQNFFSDLETTVKDKIDTAARVNKFNFVPTAILDSVQSDYDSLFRREEFKPFVDKLTTSRTAALAYGVDKASKALIESSVQTLQINSGIEAINKLEAKYGIDLASARAELNQRVVEKGSQLGGIKDAMGELKKVGAEVPSAEAEPGTQPGEVFQSNKQPQPQTPQAPTGNQPAAEPAVPNQPQFREYVVRKGDTLSAIAQRELGDSRRFKEIADLNKLPDPNKIQVGQKLKIQI